MLFIYNSSLCQPGSVAQCMYKNIYIVINIVYSWGKYCCNCKITQAAKLHTTTADSRTHGCDLTAVNYVHTSVIFLTNNSCLKY